MRMKRIRQEKLCLLLLMNQIAYGVGHRFLFMKLTLMGLLDQTKYLSQNYSANTEDKHYQNRSQFYPLMQSQIMFLMVSRLDNSGRRTKCKYQFLPMKRR